jgi:hypothetical protein
MSVVGHSPSDGHRLELRREAAENVSPWAYEGVLDTADAGPLPVLVTFDSAGACTFGEGSRLSDDHRERIERTLRTALRAARQEDPSASPPRRITRWRGDDGK